MFSESLMFWHIFFKNAVSYFVVEDYFSMSFVYSGEQRPYLSLSEGDLSSDQGNKDNILHQGKDGSRLLMVPFVRLGIS